MCLTVIFTDCYTDSYDIVRSLAAPILFVYKKIIEYRVVKYIHVSLFPYFYTITIVLLYTTASDKIYFQMKTLPSPPTFAWLPPVIVNLTKDISIFLFMEAIYMFEPVMNNWLTSSEAYL